MDRDGSLGVDGLAGQRHRFGRAAGVGVLMKLRPQTFPGRPNKQKGSVRSAKKGESAKGVKGGEQLKGLRPKRQAFNR